MFESAARLGSFSLAAKELSISQPAVSASIKQLEDQVGAPLFFRDGSALKTTPEATKLAAKLSRGFEEIRTGLEIFKSRKVSKNSLTLLCASESYNYVIAQDIVEFLDKHPDLTIQFRIVPDWSLNNAILAFRPDIVAGYYAPEEMIDYEKYYMGRLIYYPVCTPEYLEKHPISSISDIANHRLISYQSETDTNDSSWREWMAINAIKHKQVDRWVLINDYTSCIFAALEGQGILMGYPACHRLIESGKLVPAFSPIKPVDSAWDMHCLVVKSRSKDPVVVELMDHFYNITQTCVARFSAPVVNELRE